MSGTAGDTAMGPDLFLEVTGATPSSTDIPASYTGHQFNEWTPTDTFMGCYTALLQGQAQGEPQQQQQAKQQSASQSSQASATEVSAPGSSKPEESEQGGKGGGGGMGGWFKSAREKVKRWKNRTPVQNEANKAAQKRYRERKKGQAAELQAQADALAAQVQALQVVQEENAALEASNSALEQQLSGSSPGGNASADSKSAAQQQPQQQTSTSSGASEWQTFNDQFLHVVEELGAYLQSARVRPSPSDEATAPGVIEEINARMMAAMDKCMAALNLGGLCLQSLIDAVKTRKRLSSWQGLEGPGGSYQAAARLNLTPEQIRRGLQYRAHILAVLEKIYAEREGLNQRVAALLQSNAAGPDVAAALAALKANLAAEMRAVSEEHFLLLRMLLSPTQGAWLLVESFPMHCDCLAFFNGLHAAYGDGQ